MQIFKLSLLLFLACFYANASDCDKWFNGLGINSKDKDCLLKCSSAKVDMSNYDCPSRCPNLCNKGVLTNVLFTTQTILYYPGFTKTEKALTAEYPTKAIRVYLSKEKAEELTTGVFKRSGLNDESDAFRHFVWACLLTVDIGEDLTIKFLNAHEQNDKTQSESERAMDLANNRIGILRCNKFQKGEVSTDDVKKLGLEELKNRNLVILKSKGELK